MDINILLVILMVIIIVILLFKQDNSNIEGFTSENLEAIQNLSSMYENGDLKVKDLTVTGSLGVNGNANVNGYLMTNEGKLRLMKSGNTPVIETDGGELKFTGINMKGYTKIDVGDLYIYGGITSDGGLSIDAPVSFNNDVALNDHKIYIRKPKDNNHYIQYNSSLDGPEIVGNKTIKLSSKTLDKYASAGDVSKNPAVEISNLKVDNWIWANNSWTQGNLYYNKNSFYQYN
tara:strand:- start:22 stop:717 length:696 start_codon:yes stop_codon:yes gene_type:complete